MTIKKPNAEQLENRLVNARSKNIPGIDIDYLMKDFELPENKTNELNYLKKNELGDYVEEIMYVHNILEDLAEKQGMNLKEYVLKTLANPKLYEPPTPILLDLNDPGLNFLKGPGFVKEAPDIAYLIGAIYYLGSQEYSKQQLCTTIKEKHDAVISYGINETAKLAVAQQKSDIDVSDEMHEITSNPTMPLGGYINLMDLSNKVEEE